MINVSYRMEFNDLTDAMVNLMKDARKLHFIMAILGLAFGVLIFMLGIFKVIEPVLFLTIMGGVCIGLSISLLYTVYLRTPRGIYKRVKKKQKHLLDGANYDLTIDNGQVTLHEKNSKAEQTTTLKVDEYKIISLKGKYYYFQLDKKINATQIIVPISVLSSEQMEELGNLFGNKIKYLDLKR